MPQITGRTFYTADDATAYLKQKISSLFAARGILQDAYGRALVARSKSLTPQLSVQADQLVSDLTSSLQDQATLESRIRSVVPDAWIPQTVGLIPLLIVGVGVVAIAGAVYLHLQRVAAHRDTLALIERGVLTAAQGLAIEQAAGTGDIFGAGGLSGLFGGMGSLALGAAALFGLYLFVQARR